MKATPRQSNTQAEQGSGSTEPATKEPCTSYCLGFLFDQHGDVLLIRKKKGWQVGLLNGLGSSLDPAQHPEDGMKKATEAALGVKVPWHSFGWLQGEGFIVHLFACEVPMINTLQNPDMALMHHALNQPDSGLVADVPWLVAMAYHSLQCKMPMHYDITRNMRSPIHTKAVASKDQSSTNNEQ